MTPTPKLSLASVRRLAHDANHKLTKCSYENVLGNLNDFLGEIITVAIRVMTFSKLKAISKDHIAYAAATLKVYLPPELRIIEYNDLHHIQRCNIRAPAQHRKRSALHAEISHASFTRLVKRITSESKQSARITAIARRFLHLVAEQHILNFFKRQKQASDANAQSTSTESKVNLSSKAVLDLSTSDTLCRTFDCGTPEQVEILGVHLLDICNNIPLLLKISGTRTVDARMIQIAGTADNSGSGCVNPAVIDKRQQLDETIPENVVRVCDRILRGRVADKRVTSSASRALASLLYKRRRKI